jgi:hypothetical protein
MTIPDFLASLVRDWHFLIDANPLFSFASHQSRYQFVNALALIPTLILRIERGASRRRAKAANLKPPT